MLLLWHIVMQIRLLSSTFITRLRSLVFLTIFIGILINFASVIIKMVLWYNLWSSLMTFSAMLRRCLCIWVHILLFENFIHISIFLLLTSIGNRFMTCLLLFCEGDKLLKSFHMVERISVVMMERNLIVQWFFMALKITLFVLVVFSGTRSTSASMSCAKFGLVLAFKRLLSVRLSWNFIFYLTLRQSLGAFWHICFSYRSLLGSYRYFLSMLSSIIFGDGTFLIASNGVISCPVNIFPTILSMISSCRRALQMVSHVFKIWTSSVLILRLSAILL